MASTEKAPALFIANSDEEQGVVGSVQDGTVSDAGLAVNKRRDIGPLELISVGFNIANSWVAIATSLALAIASGGTVTLIYGVILCSITYCTIGCSLAEMASVYPLEGGQYHFTSILAPPKLNRVLSYACGIIATLSWVGLNSSVNILAAEILLAIPQYYIEGFTIANWQYFLIYQAINIVILLYNIFLAQRSMWVHDVTFALTILTFLTSVITSLARSSKADSSWVWTNFQNQTGWTDGITFLTGLITPSFMFGGLDAVLHMAEDVENPEKNVPRAMISTLTIGFITGFVFSVAMCYCVTDIDMLLQDPMPVYVLWRQATKSSTAATVFMTALFLIAFLVCNSIQQTVSRLIWSLARDKAIAGSSFFEKKWNHVPVPGLLFNSVAVFIAGCVFLGSSTAFSSFLNAALILQVLSFAMPIVLLMWHKRSREVLPETRAFKLKFGWAFNIIAVSFAIIELVFFNFPSSIPTTGSSMNYSAAVLAVCAILGGANWLFYAKKNYQGPRLKL